MTSNSLKSATQFAPYAPPPDDPSFNPQPTTLKPGPKRPWFPVHASSQNVLDASYQSGGIPTFGNAAAGGAGAVEEAQGQVNQWETKLPLRVEVLAAFAYLLGPISAFLLLILETQNDYVRFHAYQSALLMTPLVVIRILTALIGFWSWLQTLLTISIVIPAVYMSYRAHVGANLDGLARFRIPRIGQMAEDWVSEE